MELTPKKLLKFPERVGIEAITWALTAKQVVLRQLPELLPEELAIEDTGNAETPSETIPESEIMGWGVRDLNPQDIVFQSVNEGPGNGKLVIDVSTSTKEVRSDHLTLNS